MLNLKSAQNDYQSYYLTQNPFPYVGIPETSKVVFTDRELELQIIEETIKGALQGSSSHVVIVGSYGNGKTTTLKLIKDQFEEQLADALPIYIPNPGESFLELYRNFMYELGLERLERIVWSYLETIYGLKELQEKVAQGNILISEIIEKGKNRLFSEVKYTDFATALLKLILDETSFLAWRYLCGEPIISDQRRELDVVSLIDSDEKALRAFMSLKKVLNIVGYKLICLLIDELEAIEVLHPWKKQRILNGIRRLIDLNPKGLFLFLACAPEVWGNIIKEYHAFSERVLREVVLKPLDKESVRKLVVTYLNLYRINSEKMHSEIYPFTEEALQKILLAAQGNVRRVLMICNRVLDKGVQVGYPIINPDRLKQFLPDVFET